MTEFSATFFPDCSETVTWIEVYEFNASALKRSYCLELLVLVGVGRYWILNVLNVATSFTEFALGDEVCLAFASGDILYLS